MSTSKIIKAITAAAGAALILGGAALADDDPPPASRNQPAQNRQAQTRDSAQDGQQPAQRPRRNNRSLDEQRANLRQSLLNDRAADRQRQAYINSNAQETEVEKRSRQRAYETSARRRGEEQIILKDMPATSRDQLEDEFGENLTFEELRELRLKQAEQKRLASQRNQALKNWASGTTDVGDIRARAREHTAEKRREQEEQRREEENR